MRSTDLWTQPGGTGWGRLREQRANTRPRVTETAGGSLLGDTETPLRALPIPGGWDGTGGGRGHVNTCAWFMLMYGRNHHNTVKQLSSN